MLDTFLDARLVVFALLIGLIAGWLWPTALASYQNLFRNAALLQFLC